MLIEDLIVYKWSDFAQNLLSEEEIRKLLGDNLFRLYFEIYERAANFSACSVAKIIFVQKGIIKITFDNIVYEIYPNHFLQIPRGNYEFKVCEDNSAFYNVILIEDLPLEIVLRERKKIRDNAK
ncbi:hypothetical protein [Flavobacterium sp.]|uniref:hypothetical protein n=1 Tax=Flavobacterium sp. TaxID=239 RepID=UPI0031D1D026